MLPFADIFPHWKDFPKGLHVLVVDEDEEVLSDVKCKLEACDYAVTSFTSGEDALAALQDPTSTFHVVLAEVRARNGLDGFKILEATKNVPTIIMSSTENIAMTMKGIALGASDFLQKPLSDEKLRNMWQHVVRKAASTGQLELLEHQPTKESKLLQQPGDSFKKESMFVTKNDSVVTMKTGILEEDVKLADSFIEVSNNSRHLNLDPDLNQDFPVSCERLSAPATPQLEHMERISSAEYALKDSPSSNYEVDDLEDGLIIDNKCFQDKNEAAGDVLVETINSCDLNTLDETSNSCDLLDVNSHSDALANCDFEKLDSEFCAHIQFSDKLDVDDSIDNISLSSDFGIDADVLSKLDMDSEILDEIAFEQSLNIGVDCFYGTNFQEFMPEEALLLAEVAKAEKDGLVSKSMQCRRQPMRSNNKGGCTVDKKAKRAELHEGDKRSKSAEWKKKMKVDWTPELHRRFIQAVEQLGVDKAIPSRILELMGVQCLTRHNIASHLQKYRSHRKHLLEREAEAANWNDRRHLDSVQWIRTRKNGTSWSPSHSYPPPIQPRRSHGFSPIQPHPTSYGPSVAPLLHVWGHPTVDHSAMHMWQRHPVSSATWQTAEATFWQPGPMACLDAWGHPAPAPGMPWYPQPMVRLPLTPMPGVANMAVTTAPGGMVYENVDGVSCASKVFGSHPPKETVDAAINEVLKNPCTPLPLGLKSPSLESVLTELQRQGITKVPLTSS